jgi:hypothetical protein
MKDSKMQATNTIEYTREAQEKLYARWKISKKSQAAFCKEHGIPYNKFSYWRKRTLKKKLKSKPLFAAGKILDSGARNILPVGRLISSGGVRVDIFSEAVLLTLIKEAVLIV